MEKVQFNYSLKNIPAPTNREYIERLIEKTENFCKRVRWKSYFYLHPECRTEDKETFGFKSRKSPPGIRELINFEDRLKRMIHDIQFRPVKSQLQQQMQNDIRQNIKVSNKLLVKADKTSNYYRMEPNKYNELLRNNITSEYKKADKAKVMESNNRMKNIVNSLGLDDRVMKTAENQAFLTLKDHKENFANNITCRLINPTKPEVGKISKQILQRIINNVTRTSKANLWRNTSDVLDWFDNITDKQCHTFIVFDVVNFYPSITADLLNKALNFAAKHTTISIQDREIILEAKNSILINNNEVWTKRSHTMFDVTMGSFDGAESCELVGIYLLDTIKKKISGNFGLYRDDGLGAIRATPRQGEIMKKKLCALFRDEGLKITVETNQYVVNYLDVTLNLKDHTYRPFLKPNNIIKYVHRNSNHPPSITKNIPASINRRLSNISSNEQIFNSAKTPYQQALKESGYDYELKFKPTNKRYSRKRKRDILWYNPPYNKNVNTNIGKKFLSIIKEEFGKKHPLHKILNRNTIKLSYSCMNNMQNIISGHNRAILRRATDNTDDCNCEVKENCPLDGKCRTSSIVYQATVSTNSDNSKETYIGLTENQFKTRYYNHKATFTHRNKANSTELSKHIWKLKDQGKAYTIKWKIICKTKAFNRSTNKCKLCIAEKYYIIFQHSQSTLNERRELVTTCRHSNKHLLCM